MSESIVSLPIDYFPDPNKGKPIFNGQIFVGEPDLDPEILSNRKNITARQEDGTLIPISPAEQPVPTSAGGVPTYNGATVQILVDGNYSIKVLNSQGTQQYFFPNYFDGTPIVAGDDHNLLGSRDAIGVHDTVYSRSSTSTELASGVFGIDSILTLSDRDYSTWDVVAGGSADGFSVLDAGGGNTAVLRIESGVFSVASFGIVGDGVTNDTGGFLAFEAVYSGEAVNLHGETYVVDNEIYGNKYYNGFFDVAGTVLNAQFVNEIRVSSQSEHILIGEGAGESLPQYAVKSSPTGGYNIIAIGAYSQQSNQTQQNNYSIGTGALHDNLHGVYNTIFGFEAAYHTAGVGGNGILASRNVVVGDNGFRMSETGYNCMIMGRNTFYSNVDGHDCVFIGVESCAGIAPISLDGGDSNATPKSCARNVGIGTSVMFWANGDDCTFTGYNAGRNLKEGSTNSAYGSFSMFELEIDSSFLGTGIVYDGAVYNYSQLLNTITITKSAHSLVIGDSILCVFLTGDTANSNNPQVLVVTAVTANTYDVQSPASKTASGTVRVDQEWNQTPVTSSTANTASGYASMRHVRRGSFSSAFGELAFEGDSATGYVGDGSVTAMGSQTFKNLTTGERASALGVLAGSNKHDGTPNTALTNVTHLGYDTRCSADNQVQIGNSLTTAYAFGAVQDRSDERDKADITPISNGLIDFFMSVEWRTYRLDYRDDYLVSDDQGNIKKLKKDGSKKREREHVGAIAQQVQSAMKAHGVDFAGLQHHSISGGADIYTIGYQEFIGIQGEIIQRQQKRLNEIEKRLDIAGI